MGRCQPAGHSGGFPEHSKQRIMASPCSTKRGAFRFTLLNSVGQDKMGARECGAARAARRAALHYTEVRQARRQEDPHELRGRHGLHPVRDVQRYDSCYL